MQFPYPLDKTCFITGHRPQHIGRGWDDHEAHAVCKAALRRLLIRALDRGYIYFLDGVALGTDLWMAEMICRDPELIRRGAKLITVVPFPGQELQWSDRKLVTLYRELLAEAEDSYTVSMEIESPENLKNTKAWFTYMLHQRNHWMVDRGSLGIGLYNGKPSGGTYECIQYALKQKRLVCTYNPITKTFDRQDAQLSLV